jgi:tetratricopeptide (TPR) repeat protein
MPRAPLPRQSDLQGTLQQAVALHREGRLDEAERLYHGVLTGAPKNFDALNLLGVLMKQRGKTAEALALIDRALAVNAKSADALMNRANVLFAMRRFAEALAGYDKALALKPDDARLVSNRGNTLCELKRPAEAVAAFDRALALVPGDPDILNNRANALLTLNRAAEALDCCDRALAVRPRDPQTLVNRGNALTDLCRPDEALASYDAAVAAAPDNAEAHWNRSLALLAKGDLARGFAEYEWRKRRPGATDKREFTQPLWLGEGDIAGKTILLHAEQGYGDTIQFVRYAPMVAARGARIVLEVQPPLKPLFQSSAATVVARGEPLPPFDCHCPMMSLPRAFGTTLDSIPATTPYLPAPQDRVAKWRTLLSGDKPLRVGLTWSGSATHRNDHNRSIPLDALAPLFGDARIAFVSLQRDLREADRKTLRRFPQVRRLDSELNDFADTAAVISLLDLVISVDTGVAHLAGALAKPVWLLLPFIAEWRWLDGRDDSPWYPTARLFRQQNVGDWAGVMTRVHGELSRLQEGP